MANGVNGRKRGRGSAWGDEQKNRQTRGREEILKSLNHRTRAYFNTGKEKKR